MFGYVKPYVPDLRVRENELYRALYCGLCRSMGIHAGCTSRFTLSYDFVFLAAVRTVLEGCKLNIKHSRCMVHPLKKRPTVADNSALLYSAACAAVLTEAKIRDDINDSKGFHRLGAKLLFLPAARMRKKALKSANVPKDKIYSCLEKLSKLEKAHCPSIDETADAFGELLASVFSYGLPDTASRIAYEIGKGVGKYIYVIDAADDAADDRKSGSYNPLNISPVSSAALGAAVRLELESAAAAAELIDTASYPEIGEIIKNTLYEGLPKGADKILCKANIKQETTE